MATVRGCNLPEDLYFNIEHNVWARKQGDVVTVGMTSYASFLAGEIVSISAKKGKTVKQNKSCATVESGQWVGAVKAPVGGEVVKVNELLMGKPSLINEDPYGQGWLVQIQVTDWDNECGDLVTGADAMEAFEAKMEAEGFGGCGV